MAIPKEDLKQIGDLIDNKLIVYTNSVILPAVERITSEIKTEIKGVEKRLTKRIEKVENDVSRLDHKIDNITTHHAQKLDEHEKKLNQIFA